MRQRDSSLALVDVTTLLQCWGNSTGFRSDNESILSCRHRRVLCPTDQHMVRRSELCSRWTAALEQSAGQDSPARQQHWRISSAAKVVFVQVTPRCSDFLILCAFKYSDWLTHSLTIPCSLFLDHFVFLSCPVFYAFICCTDCMILITILIIIIIPRVPRVLKNKKNKIKK